MRRFFTKQRRGKNQVPVRRKAYRQFVARLETAPLDGKFLADVVRNRFLYPILHMLEAEPIRHSRRWNENLVASLACVADLDLSNACKRGDSAFIADTDAYSAVFDAVRGFVRRWDCSEELSKDVLSVGLKKANSFQVRARFVSDNLWAFRNGRAEDNMLPEKDFQGHVDAILDLFARKGRVLEAYSNEAFLRTVWCRIVKELGDPTRDAEFGSAFDPSRVSDGEMQSLLELFLVHDAREFRVAAFDLERAERLFDIGTVRSRLLNYEPANALLDYIDFAIQMKAAGRKADVASQLEVLRGVPEFSPVLASSRIRPGSGK